MRSAVPSALDPMHDAAALVPGDVLAGKYRILRCLGEGGMGRVHLAEHDTLKQRVAVKTLRMMRPDLAARFVREARAGVMLESPYVARVLDAGTTEGGAPYMVMEALTGRTLADALAEGPIDIAQAAQWMVQACAALDEAHGLGIVHRDVKPANLFLAQRRDGTVQIKVLDFGIAKAVELLGDNDTLTGTGATIGSPAYMSPEQVRAPSTVDDRTDVWSLGVVLFEIVCRARPFAAESPSGVLAAIAADAPGEVPRSVPTELAAIIGKCLQKNRDDRYASVALLARALAPFGGADAEALAQRLGVRKPATPADATADPISTPASDATAAGGTTAVAVAESRPKRTATGRAQLASLLALAGIAGLGVTAYRSAGSSSSAAQTNAPTAVPSPTSPAAASLGAPATSTPTTPVSTATPSASVSTPSKPTVAPRRMPSAEPPPKPTPPPVSPPAASPTARDRTSF